MIDALIPVRGLAEAVGRSGDGQAVLLLKFPHGTGRLRAEDAVAPIIIIDDTPEAITVSSSATASH